MQVGTVRLAERRNYPDLSPEALAWRVTRRMQGDPSLGREFERRQRSEPFDRMLAMARHEVEEE